jgi:hypothetical protein
MRKFLADWKNADLDWRSAFIVVTIASVVSLLFCLFGFPVAGHDSDVHLNWLDQYTRLAGQGIFYPRWLPMSFGGFGAATFYFYPPLEYWLAGFPHLVCPMSPSALYNMLIAMASVASAYTAWRLLREYSANSLIVLTGALVYSFIGYRFADAFVRDALGEHVALIFLPMIFWHVEGRIKQIVLIAVAWSGLFLSNIPTAFIAAIAAMIIIALEVNRRAKILDYGVGVIIALLISAVYLLPALALRDQVQTQHLWDTHFASTGFAVLDLLQGQRGWLKTLALATLFTGLVCIIAERRNKRSTVHSWWWLAVFAIVIQIPIAPQLWHGPIPFGPIQFSWRWNGALLLAIAIMTVKGKSPVTPFILIALAAITLFGEARLSQEFALHPKLPFDRYRIDAPEYAPKWTPSDANVVRVLAYRHIDDPPAIPLGLTFPGDSIQLLSRTPKEWIFHARLSRNTPVRFHQFYWPYWKAFRGSDTVVVRPDSIGFATAMLPSGSYELRLMLVRSPYEKAGSIISYIGAALLIVLLGATSYRRLKHS